MPNRPDSHCESPGHLSPKVLDLDGCFSSENLAVLIVTLFCGRVLSERALRPLLNFRDKKSCVPAQFIKGRQTGGVSNRGGFPIWTCPSFFSFFVLFGGFPDFSGIFPICSGMVRGFSRLVLFLFLGLLRAPTRNSPERVRDTIWTFPKKSGKHPGLETPRFSFSQIY